jgi:hypothetical protein
VKAHLAAAALVSMLTIGSASSDAWAAYGVGNAASCVTFTSLSGALAFGGTTIWVSDTNIEPATSFIAGKVTLRTAVQNCDPGGAGRIELAAGATTRVLEVLAGTATKKNELDIIGVTVSGGDVTGDGGTIYVQHDSILHLEVGARVELGAATGRGGCIYADHAQILMDPGSSVGECTAVTDGGGVAISSVHTPGAYHTLRRLDANAALSGNGGGVWVDSARVCLFEASDNSAALDGGAAYVTSAIGIAWLGTFDIQARNAAGRDGGAVFITGPQSSLDAASRLTTNIAVGNGGGIRATAASVVHLDPGVVISLNNAQGDGGGVHGDALATVAVSLVGDPAAIGDGEASHGTCGDATGRVSLDANRAGFDALGNQTNATRDGGGVYLSAASLSGSQVWITNNVASDSGGGVAAFAASTVDLARARLASNVATLGDGGGLLARDDGSAATLERTTFDGNTARGGGGGEAVIGAETSLDNVTFTANTATLGGGLGLNSGSTAAVTTATLSSNSALSGGGIFVGPTSTLTMLQGTISSNTADLGAGIAALSGTAILGDQPPACPSGGVCVTISTNTASGVLGRGGAIALSGPNAHVEVRRTRIVGNLANQGGATWMDRSDHTLYLHNSAILDNHGNNGVVSAVAVQAGTLAMLDDTVAFNDIGIGLLPPTAATMRDSLVIQNLVDIGGLNLGASMTGNCNGVQFAATQAAIAGTSNVATTSATASVNAATGAPINTADIINQCGSGLLQFDLRGFARPVGNLYDRGAYEVQ